MVVNEMSFEKNKDGSVSVKINNEKLLSSKQNVIRKKYKITKLDYRLFKVEDKEENPHIYDDVYILPSFVFLKYKRSTDDVEIWVPAIITWYDNMYVMMTSKNPTFPDGTSDAFNIFPINNIKDKIIRYEDETYYEVNSLMNELNTLNKDNITYTLISMQYLPNVIYTYKLEEK